MLTTPSIEIRWFESGSIPEKLKEHFNKDSLGSILGEFPETREDLYLVIPESDRLSVKLRQGKLFEIKLRQTELGSRQFAWDGKVERWTKWSYEDISPLSIIDVPARSTWHKIKKTRWQRFHSGVYFEITQLYVNNKPWWTVAFEMLEDGTNDFDRFYDTVNSISQNYPMLNLCLEKSYAYPRWLLNV